MTKFVRVIDTEKCMGCRACVAACQVENFSDSDSQWNVMNEHEIGSYPNTSKAFVTMGCMHCEDAPCIRVCDEIGAHAITKNEYGVVLIDYDKCISCGYCAPACPYGVPKFPEKTGDGLYPIEKTAYDKIPVIDKSPLHVKQENKAQKCTFCWHRLEKAIDAGKIDRIGKDPEYTPACDVVCSVNARAFGDIDDPNSEVSKLIGEKKAAQLKKEYGTGPQVFYVLEGGDY